jgi:hypothetical protein
MTARASGQQTISNSSQTMRCEHLLVDTDSVAKSFSGVGNPEGRKKAAQASEGWTTLYVL